MGYQNTLCKIYLPGSRFKIYVLRNRHFMLCKSETCHQLLPVCSKIFVEYKNMQSNCLHAVGTHYDVTSTLKEGQKLSSSINEKAQVLFYCNLGDVLQQVHILTTAQYKEASRYHLLSHRGQSHYLYICSSESEIEKYHEYFYEITM